MSMSCNLNNAAVLLVRYNSLPLECNRVPYGHGKNWRSQPPSPTLQLASFTLDLTPIGFPRRPQDRFLLEPTCL